jgi:type 1 fimbriae regulatory protein FimB/type 1 fimbriae regulatory protein FimE
MFRHGLRVSEAGALRWADVDLERGNVHVRRVKNGDPSVHPLSGRELRALRRLKREQEPASPFVFNSERGSPFTRDGIAKFVARAGGEAGFDHAVHAHMLRHACGYKLANDGTDTRTIQAYLGHRSIQHTVKYTALAPDRFNRLWRD